MKTLNCRQSAGPVESMSKCSPQCPPEIKTSLSAVAETADRLESLITDLRARLNPVLRPQPPASIQQLNEGGACSPLAEEIHSINCRLRRGCEDIADILEYCDL